MDQNRPFLVASENHEQLPILIIDKQGMIGGALAHVLREQFLVVIVTSSDMKRHENLVHVPYRKKLPLIPDNAYSHIFLIYHGEKELLETLSLFEQKAEATNAKLFFITSLLLSSPKLFSRLKKSAYTPLQTVLYGETFDTMLKEPNEINYYIQQARTTGRIEVSKDGLGTLYPILLDDVVASLISLAFAVERPKETIFLFPHHVFTQISLVRVMQKIEPLIKVDFGKKKHKVRELYIPKQGLYFYRDYQLEDRLRRIDLSLQKKEQKTKGKQIRINVPNSEMSETRLKLFGIALLAIFVAPVLLTGFIALLGYGIIGLSFKKMESGNLHASTTTAQVARYAFQSASLLSPTLVLPRIVFPHPTQAFVDNLQLGESVADTEISLLQAFGVIQNVYNNQSLDPKNDFLRSLATVKNALLTMQKLEAENKLPQPIAKKLESYSSALNLIEGTIDTWPDLLGFDKKKQYLLLFQNNMELRPGGGFIGSYGILPVENARFDKLQIHNVYDADGQLTQHVEPPYGLRRYLGVSHLFLRDSNFDPDFIRNGVLAKQMLQKETGEKVDGTIAIDTNFLKSLIGVVGSVHVPEYNQTVTEDNFYLTTQTHAEKNSFAGSTQKQDFLRSFTNALLQKIFSSKHLPYEKLVQMVTTAIAQKHLLFAFSDSNIQNVFTVNGFSSSLKDARTSQKNTAFDYGGVVDANIGTNKANYYVTRSLNQHVTITERGDLEAITSATYTNSSTKTSPFGGDYRDYVQFVIPESASLTSVAIDGKETEITAAITDPSVFISEWFTPPPGLEVAQTDELGKKVIGFFFIVPMNQTKTVSITYATPNAIDTRQAVFTYDIHAFKQPGTDADPYQLWVSYPNSFSVVVSDKRLSDVGGKLIYSSPLLEDIDLSATFSKK